MRKRLWWMFCVTGIVLTLVGSLVAPALDLRAANGVQRGQAALAAFVGDEVLVKFASSATLMQINQFLLSLGYDVESYLAGIEVYHLDVPAGTAPLAVSLLNNSPLVAWAELNYQATGELTPSDPDYGDPLKVYAPQRINAPAGWDLTTGSASIIVAVVDSGLSLGHPEFSGRIVTGYDFVNGDTNPTDDHGHGTHVAGIVAAAINNGAGSTGIAPGVKIMPVKVLNNQNSGNLGDIASGILYAADNGARIINLSLGSVATSQTLADAIVYAYNRGALIVAAAGNYASNSPFYPAYYSQTLAVAATDSADLKWPDSNYGAAIDVAAPGFDVWSTLWTSAASATYGKMSGTSMAAPHVSGLAALILSLRPSLSAADVRALIEQHAADLGAAGRDDYFGFGRIDVGATLAAVQGWVAFTPTPTATPTRTPTSTPTPTPAPYLQRVNAGGTSYTDTLGQVWAADKAFATGSWGYTAGTAASSTTAVNGTTDDPLYQKWRDSPGEYKFTLPNGNYVVKLRFADFSSTSSTARLIKITVEGVIVETGLSIYSMVGKATALERTYYANVVDGVLNIAFAKSGNSKGTPIVNGLQVASDLPPTPTPTPTPTNTPCATCPTPTFTPTRTPTPTSTPTNTPAPYSQRVNVGGVSFTDGGGQVWAADKAFATGSWGYSTGSAKSSTAAVANTTDDLLYQKYREIAGEYRFTVPNGTYQVTLKLAEFVYASTTNRSMKITLESTVVETALNAYALAGGLNAAVDRTYTVTVTDGVLNIIFAKGTSANRTPAINAIWVRSQ